jgi:MFS family permease
MFGAPYFLGLASELDPAGRVAAAARGFNAAGAALAPAIAGGILGVTGSYRSIGWTSLGAAVAALGLVLFVAARKPRDSTLR